VRVQHRLGLGACGLVEQRVARDHAFGHQPAVEIPPHRSSLGAQRRCTRGLAQKLEGLGQRVEHLGVQRHRPGAAQVLAQAWISRLQRIVPVAVAIGCECRAGDAAVRDHREGAFGVLPQGRHLGRGSR
jgi:hypothetical protein